MFLSFVNVWVVDFCHQFILFLFCHYKIFVFFLVIQKQVCEQKEEKKWKSWQNKKKMCEKEEEGEKT